MMRSLPTAAAVALGAGLLLAGCQSQSHSCTNSGCHVTVSGAGQTVELDSPKGEVDVTVTAIEADSVTMSAGGAGAVEIADGASAQVGPVTVKITSIEGDTVKFDVN